MQIRCKDAAHSHSYAVSIKTGALDTAKAPATAKVSIVSHIKKSAPEGCVPVSKAGRQRPKGLPERLLACQQSCAQTQNGTETHRPDTRSPQDPWHSEGYLIRCLVRMHGWHQIEPGLIRRFRRA